jgi:hypothetical protein
MQEEKWSFRNKADSKKFFEETLRFDEEVRYVPPIYYMLPDVHVNTWEVIRKEREESLRSELVAFYGKSSLSEKEICVLVDADDGSLRCDDFDRTVTIVAELLRNGFLEQENSVIELLDAALKLPDKKIDAGLVEALNIADEKIASEILFTLIRRAPFGNLTGQLKRKISVPHVLDIFEQQFHARYSAAKSYEEGTSLLRQIEEIDNMVSLFELTNDDMVCRRMLCIIQAYPEDVNMLRLHKEWQEYLQNKEGENLRGGEIKIFNFPDSHPRHITFTETKDFTAQRLHVYELPPQSR